MSRHRFRPRYRGVAWTAIGIGGAIAGIAAAALGAALLPLASGAAGIVLGSAYLMSPTWRLEVVADDAGLEVTKRYRIAWNEIVRVIASPSTKTCFVDGGTPEKSLIVPGVGALAPYDLDDKAALFDAILAHVPADKVTTVETLEAARRT